jgi:asparagine synthase (glutamine-hydrolysing)
MSVQAGIWNLDGKPVDREALAQISSYVADCGTDGEDIWIDGNIGMLYRPFQTTLDSCTEQQPHVFEQRKVITWDGRLDNRDDLVLELGDSSKVRPSDLSIVEALLDRSGTDCFRKIIGDWALSLWNPKTQSLILARDYAGIRRLYYHRAERTIVWCSHLAPLALLANGLTLNEEYIASYLAMRPEPDLTPYCEIHCVPPGNFVRISDLETVSRAYWTFEPPLANRFKNDRECEDQFRFLLRQAVRRRLRSNAPILAELSGGFDSSAIVCLADEIMASEGAETLAVDTFSYSFPDEPEGDDILYFTKIKAKRARAGHHVSINGVGDSFCLRSSKFCATPGFGIRNEVASARSKVLDQGGYKVILSGIGGDEFMGQALDPRVQMADLLKRRHFQTLNRQLISWSLLTRRPWIQLLAETLLLLLPTSIRSRLTHGIQAEEWMNQAFSRRFRFPSLLLQATAGAASWLPSARDALQTYRTLIGLLTNSSLTVPEIRYPYLDQNLVEFMISIPTDQLLRPGDRRSLMRRALADVLPAEVLARKTKQSETRCHVVTLVKHWEEIEQYLVAPLSAELNYVKITEFRAALFAAKNGQLSRQFLLLLRALSLEVWLRQAVAHNVISVRPSEKFIAARANKFSERSVSLPANGP